VCPDCAVEQFTEHGKTFRIAVHNYAEGARETPSSPESRASSSGFSKLVEGVEKIVASEMATMPDPDFPHYTFLFHFAPDLSNGGDGMEHLNSTQIVIQGALTGAGLSEALEDTAHEFFHVWNVKRLRPAALGPFDYTREDYTPSLWFAEGVTSYCAYASLLRSGIWGRKEFLQRLAEEVRALEL